LINIKKWDFNWQGDYQFRQLIKVPAGSVIHAFAGYDNTTNNVNNPHDPPQSITWGQGTAEEMYYLPITYLKYQPGDEDIVFETDSVTTGNSVKLTGMADKLYPVFPVPSQDEMTIGYTLAQSGKVSVQLLSADGKKVLAIENDSFHLPGYHTRRIPVSKLSPGIYLLEMTKGQDRQTQKVVVGR
nr:T9SS type A sorting domain-containing protein [Catalimonadaceae bacterium]